MIIHGTPKRSATMPKLVAKNVFVTDRRIVLVMESSERARDRHARDDFPAREPAGRVAGATAHAAQSRAVQARSRTAEATPADSLRGLRVVVTVPPEGWFYGLARQYGALYADVLRQAGAAVLGIPIEPFSSGRQGDAEDVLRAARRFRPDVAIGLHDAGYALLCGMPRGRAPAAANLFVDGLGVPTVLLWDHALLQFAPILLGALPDHPDGSRAGCLRRFREGLSHPLYLHAVRDSGQREMVHALGVLPRKRMLLEPAFVDPHFERHAGRGAPGRLADVAFIGHMRPPALERRPARHHPALLELREAALREKCGRFDLPLLEVVRSRIAALPAALRATLRLEPDESFHWSLLASEMDLAQTRVRTALLEGLGREVDFFGDFGSQEPAGRVRLRAERFHFGAELARAYAATRIVVDVVNPGFVHGYGCKVVSCFAAGGFLLQDRKRDFVERFGELGEAVSYASPAELEAKLDRFLSHERERAEISETLGERMRKEHSLADALRRLVVRALELRA